LDVVFCSKNADEILHQKKISEGRLLV